MKIDTGMAPGNKQDDVFESTSSASSFETHYASKPTEFPNLDTLEIDKKLRSNGISTLLHSKKSGETFLYVTSSPTADHSVVEEGTFIAYSSNIAKRLCELSSLRIGYAAKWTC